MRYTEDCGKKGGKNGIDGKRQREKEEERERGRERQGEKGKEQCGLFIRVNPDTVAFSAHMDWIRGYAGHSSTV